MMAKKKRITICLDEQTLAAITRCANEDNRSVGGMVRHWVLVGVTQRSSAFRREYQTFAENISEKHTPPYMSGDVVISQRNAENISETQRNAERGPYNEAHADSLPTDTIDSLATDSTHSTHSLSLDRESRNAGDADQGQRGTNKKVESYEERTTAKQPFLPAVYIWQGHAKKHGLEALSDDAVESLSAITISNLRSALRERDIEAFQEALDKQATNPWALAEFTNLDYLVKLSPRHGKRIIWAIADNDYRQRKELPSPRCQPEAVHMTPAEEQRDHDERERVRWAKVRAEEAEEIARENAVREKRRPIRKPKLVVVPKTAEELEEERKVIVLEEARSEQYREENRQMGLSMIRKLMKELG